MQLKASTCTRPAGPKRARAATVAKAASDAGPPPAWPQRCVPPEVKHRDTPKVTVAMALALRLPGRCCRIGDGSRTHVTYVGNQLRCAGTRP
jgi:hypothetical protein